MKGAEVGFEATLNLGGMTGFLLAEYIKAKFLRVGFWPIVARQSSANESAFRGSSCTSV